MPIMHIMRKVTLKTSTQKFDLWLAHFQNYG